MRDRETIDSELRCVAAELRSIRERGGRPSSRQLDALLDERLGHPADALCDLAILDEICLPADEADNRRLPDGGACCCAWRCARRSRCP